MPVSDAHIYASGMSDLERICQRPYGGLMQRDRYTHTHTDAHTKGFVPHLSRQRGVK